MITTCQNLQNLFLLIYTWHLFQNQSIQRSLEHWLTLKSQVLTTKFWVDQRNSITPHAIFHHNILF